MRHGCRFVGLSLVFLAIGGCADPVKEEAVRFSNDVFAAANEIGGINKAMIAGIEAEVKDLTKAKPTPSPTQIKNMEAAYEKQRKEFDAAHAKVKKIAVPADAEAQTFWSAFNAIVANQAKHFHVDYPLIIDGYRDPAKKAKAYDAYLGIQNGNKADDLALVQAQQTYAKAKGLRVK